MATRRAQMGWQDPSDVCADRSEQSGEQMSRRGPRGPCVFNHARLFTAAFIPFVLLYVDCPPLLWGGQ